jgi:hypothetical protein
VIDNSRFLIAKAIRNDSSVILCSMLSAEC